MDVVFDANVIVSGLRSSRGASFCLLQKIRAADPSFRLHLSTAVVLGQRSEVGSQWSVAGSRRSEDLGLSPET